MLGINHKIIISEEIEIPGYADNPPDRCYYCKSELFGKIKYIASKEGFDAILDGSNADDLKDFRPGMKAKQEKGVISPLADSGFTKNRYSSFFQQNLNCQLPRNNLMHVSLRASLMVKR